MSDYTGLDDDAELARHQAAEACSEFLEDPSDEAFGFFRGLLWALTLVGAALAFAFLAFSASQTL